MKLASIIANAGAVSIKGDVSIDITAVTPDSRKVCPGSLFVAVSGCGNDGHAYIGAALEAGASAVAYENEQMLSDALAQCPEGSGATLIKVQSSKKAAAIIADAFYDHPSGKITLVGITGTNGKTTTVTLLYNLFRSLGYNCGLLSTIANFVGERRLETANTTSDPFTINSLMAQMVEDGCEYCFMEVSSIGVEQERVSGLEFKMGLFSNLTHDHLDYHGTFAEYLRCKKLFFDNLGKDAIAIINSDDRNGSVMVQNCKARTVTTSCRSMADHNCRIMEESFEGMLVKLDGTEVWTKLIGQHNAYNILAIYSAAVELGADSSEVLVALSSLDSAKGRLETIRGPKGLTAVIDYAHTPDALENVLKTLRDIAPQNPLVCLFGCGGDRDKTKRPEMAKVAQEYADRIIVTSDNSRTERTEDILEDIRKGFTLQGLTKSLFISDRKEAIRTAFLTAVPGSAVLLAGKGHETYQICGKEKLHFDEREIVGEVFELINQGL